MDFASARVALLSWLLGTIEDPAAALIVPEALASVAQQLSAGTASSLSHEQCLATLEQYLSSSRSASSRSQSGQQHALLVGRPLPPHLLAHLEVFTEQFAPDPASHCQPIADLAFDSNGPRSSASTVQNVPNNTSNDDDDNDDDDACRQKSRATLAQVDSSHADDVFVTTSIAQIVSGKQAAIPKPRHAATQGSATSPYTPNSQRNRRRGVPATAPQSLIERAAHTTTPDMQLAVTQHSLSPESAIAGPQPHVQQPQIRRHSWAPRGSSMPIPLASPATANSFPLAKPPAMMQTRYPQTEAVVAPPAFALHSMPCGQQGAINLDLLRPPQDALSNDYINASVDTARASTPSLSGPLSASTTATTPSSPPSQRRKGSSQFFFGDAVSVASSTVDLAEARSQSFIPQLPGSTSLFHPTLLQQAHGQQSDPRHMLGMLPHPLLAAQAPSTHQHDPHHPHQQQQLLQRLPLLHQGNPNRSGQVLLPGLMLSARISRQQVARPGAEGKAEESSELSDEKADGSQKRKRPKVVCPVCGGPGRGSQLKICGVCFGGVFNDIQKWMTSLGLRRGDPENGTYIDTDRFISDLQTRVPRGCRSDYSCPPEAYSHKIYAYDRCCRCRSLHVCRLAPERIEQMLTHALTGE